MKGGLREPPLAAMIFALARQQSFAQQTLRALQRTPLHERILMRDEHILDEVWMVEHVGVLRPHAEVNDVAVVARQRRQKGERVAAEREEAEQWTRGQHAPRAGREFQCSSDHDRGTPFNEIRQRIIQTRQARR